MQKKPKKLNKGLLDSVAILALDDFDSVGGWLFVLLHPGVSSLLLAAGVSLLLSGEVLSLVTGDASLLDSTER